MAEALKAAFPYPPYDIQQQFMINVVDTLEKKQIGLFESPTGTGKTLSVICSTLYWLEVERERQAKAAAEAAQKDIFEGLPDWLAAAPTVQTLPSAAQQKPQKTKKAAHKPKAALLDDEGNDLSEFLPDTSSKQCLRDTASPGSKRTAPDAGSYSSSSSEDEAADTAQDADTDVAAATEERRQPQVIFCSRTHSQLSQFVGELHKTRFGSSVLLVAVASRKALCVNYEVRQLSELSQVNERCLDLQRSRASGSSSSSSKKKASLQGAATSNVVGFLGASRPRQQQQQQRRQRKSAGCPYLSVEGGASAWDDFKSHVLRSPMDVEELASLGRKQKICPYYGSRRAVPSADVVLAPYSAVLMPDARDSLGIQLQDSVLVFDEAHNLLDAINGAHSTTVTSWQLLSVQRSLTAYYDRFKAVLNPLNADNIQRLLLIASALHKCLQHQQQTPQEQQQHAGSAAQPSSSSVGRVTTVNDLLFDLGLDTFNMFELAYWVRDNKMAFKVSGYTAAAVAKAGGSIQLQQHPQPGSKSTAPMQSADDDTSVQQPQQQQHQQSLGHLSAKDGVSAIHSFISFILSLTHADADGRIIVEPAAVPPTAAAGDNSRPEQASKGGQLRYVLLNAAGHFGKLLASARSVLLVSGTLAPIHGLQAQLFPDVAPERVRHFECGHVVPKEQLLAVSIGRGPSGRPLNLKHGGRGDASVMAELGQLLVNLCGVVPEGLVVFVPSFSYLEQLTQHWRVTGLWDRLSQRKQVFSEPRAATDVEAVLAAYAAAISGEPPASTTTKGPPEDAAAGVTAPAQPTTTANSAGSAAAAALAGAAGAGTSSQCKGSGRGALMLCVVGAKLSEGINFGDGLGRCVVVVGLPYPNSTDVELQARMQYLDRLAAQAASGTPAAAAAVAAGHSTGPQNSSQHQAAGDSQGQQQQQQQGQPAEPPARRSVFQVLNQGRPWAVPPAAQQPQSAAGSAAISQDVAAQQPPQPEGVTNTAAVDQAELDKASAAIATTASSNSGSSKVITGREYYEDLCFKAVNQCVGRVVRHKGDYAAVVLLDTRWVAGPAEWAAVSSSSSGGQGSRGGSRRTVPVQKLPGWLQRSYVPTSGDFGPALKELVGFFRRQAQQAPA